MINDHLYEGRFSPRVNGKRIAKNIYATTREECEEKLKVLIEEMKKEIAEIKAEKEKMTGGPKKSPCQNLRCCRQRIQSLIKILIINLIDSFNINNK